MQVPPFSEIKLKLNHFLLQYRKYLHIFFLLRGIYNCLVKLNRISFTKAHFRQHNFFLFLFLFHIQSKLDDFIEQIASVLEI